MKKHSFTLLKKYNILHVTATHFGFCDWPLQLYTNQKGHIQLMIHELLNPCCFIHLVTRDVQLQSSIVLMIRILNFSYNSGIPCHH
jgi:hypothetical protein